MKLLELVKSCVKSIRTIELQNYELLWAETLKNASKDIKWIQCMPAISPGRWAVGYNYLYVMTRILNEKNPHTVLDLGLGISSTLFTNYFKYFDYPDGMHIVVEQDETWANFYMEKNQVSSCTKVCVCDSIEKKYKGYVRSEYEDFSHIIKGKKFQVISIDGLKGSLRYSRGDIVSRLPEILDDSWVIIIDDAQRTGERDTIQEIETKLDEFKIEYCVGYYPGMSQCCVITSSDNRFLCSL